MYLYRKSKIKTLSRIKQLCAETDLWAVLRGPCRMHRSFLQQPERQTLYAQIQVSRNDSNPWRYVQVWISRCDRHFVTYTHAVSLNVCVFRPFDQWDESRAAPSRICRILCQGKAATPGTVTAARALL